MEPRNSRRHERTPAPATIRIGWQDRSGNDKFDITRSFDISESGLRFEVQYPLPPRSDVTVQAEKIGLQARATVRYCIRKGLKYAVGVEFAGGYRWRPRSENAPPAG